MGILFSTYAPLALFVGYLLGSIPFGLLLTRWAGLGVAVMDVPRGARIGPRPVSFMSSSARPDICRRGLRSVFPR